MGVTLSSAEVSLLRDVRVSDEDHGGLAFTEIQPDEHDALERLASLGLIETTGEYGEAPDGEEDERDAGASVVVYRITERGVAALRDRGG